MEKNDHKNYQYDEISFLQISSLHKSMRHDQILRCFRPNNPILNENIQKIRTYSRDSEGFDLSFAILHDEEYISQKQECIQVGEGVSARRSSAQGDEVSAQGKGVSAQGGCTSPTL